MAQYLSKATTQRCRMEEVQYSTSREMKMFQVTCPSVHLFSTW